MQRDLDEPEGPLVFAGSASPRLTRDLRSARRPGRSGEVLRFSEGTLFPRVLENVRGRRVYLVQSTVFPANDHLVEDAVSCGARMLDRRIHEGWTHSGPRNFLGDVDAAELRALGWNVGVWAGQYVGVPDGPTGQPRNEDRRVRAELGKPFCEVGGGCLDRKSGQVRPGKELAVAPPAGSNAHLRDGSRVG